jgi:hypothetical protein
MQTCKLGRNALESSVPRDRQLSYLPGMLTYSDYVVQEFLLLERSNTVFLAFSTMTP